jgi:hypothetical protein
MTLSEASQPTPEIEMLDEFELDDLRFNYPDFSRNQIATKKLLELTEQERLAYELFMNGRKMPTQVNLFIRELSVGYHQRDPERQSTRARAMVLEHLEAAGVYLNIFTNKSVVPVLASRNDENGEPDLGWDIFVVTEFYRQCARDSLNRLDFYIAGTIDPEVYKLKP